MAGYKAPAPRPRPHFTVYEPFNFFRVIVRMSSSLHVGLLVSDPNCHFKFDPWIYIKEYYGRINCWHRNPLKHLHNFYTSHFQKGADLTVLNFGCGPIVAFEGSVAPYARELVLAEYTDQNRAVAKLWVDKDPTRPDFNAQYKYVVEELEGNGPEEVEKRQDAVRRIATLCSCDIFQDPPIQKGYEGPYDVVYTASCLEMACSNIEDYGMAVSKLCGLVKPGGWLVMHVSMRGKEEGVLNICHVGPVRFVELNVTVDEMYAMLQDRCGFERDSITVIPAEPEGNDLSPEQLAEHMEDMMFVIAQKKLSTL